MMTDARLATDRVCGWKANIHTSFEDTYKRYLLVVSITSKVTTTHNPSDGRRIETYTTTVSPDRNEFYDHPKNHSLMDT